MNKRIIIEYLTEKGNYNKAFDFNIMLLLDQIAIYKLARKSIKEDGLNVNGDALGSFKVRNQQFKTLTECLQNIRGLSKALGLSVGDSIIFKQLNEGDIPDDDGFDSL